MDRPLIGIVTGTGFDRFVTLVRDFQTLRLPTPYGTVYAQKFTRRGVDFVHVNRHACHAPIEDRGWRLPMYLDRQGREHWLDPRRPLTALARLGIRTIAATSAVGACKDIPVGSVVLPNQLRTPEFGILTFASKSGRAEFHRAYDRLLWCEPHARLIKHLHRHSVCTVLNGTLKITRGPGFETEADYEVLKAQGVDIVGMHTALPEAFASHNLGIRYVLAAIVTDSIAEHPDQDDIERIARDVGERVFSTVIALGRGLAKFPRELKPVPGLRERLKIA